MLFILGDNIQVFQSYPKTVIVQAPGFLIENRSLVSGIRYGNNLYLLKEGQIAAFSKEEGPTLYTFSLTANPHFLTVSSLFTHFSFRLADFDPNHHPLNPSEAPRTVWSMLEDDILEDSRMSQPPAPLELIPRSLRKRAETATRSFLRNLLRR